LVNHIAYYFTSEIPEYRKIEVSIIGIDPGIIYEKLPVIVLLLEN